MGFGIHKVPETNSPEDSKEQQYKVSCGMSHGTHFFGRNTHDQQEASDSFPILSSSCGGRKFIGHAAWLWSEVGLCLSAPPLFYNANMRTILEIKNKPLGHKCQSVWMHRQPFRKLSENSGNKHLTTL
jgi:hypothetical protein